MRRHEHGKKVEIHDRERVADARLDPAAVVTFRGLAHGDLVEVRLKL